QWDKSLGDLYQTVLQPALLTPALTGINAMMDSDFCHLFGVTSAGEESFTIVTNKDRVAAVEQYAQEYGRIDPRRQFVDRLIAAVPFAARLLSRAASFIRII
ncbi:MAG: hypothetical protein RSD99_24335, partial [Janthinobacterium sp.]